ncbi:Pol polyprotein [Elysia marginata]|uniref:Pol polyprotein n=1 Tax=Elysia marginata TaxID=1093978 RepID=A0AAV4JE64_9GAST|nr:Pol polyprotein [Elysia marginata]
MDYFMNRALCNFGFQSNLVFLRPPVKMEELVNTSCVLLIDNGKQLISEAMTEVMKMLGIERRTCTPYHAQANGMVERLNGSLKTMLKKLTRDKPNTLDKLQPAVLLAYR